MKKTILSLVILLGFSSIGFAYTTRQETQYTVNSSTADGVYQVIKGTYVFTDSLNVSSAPAASYTPRIIIDGSNGTISNYSLVFSTAQTNYQVGITTPAYKGIVFWDNTKNEICISTGTTNCKDYSKFSLTTP
jgi:uncharacterized alpha/beta hydrolase family protein